MDFFRLSKMSLPSSTPVTMEAKLSSRRIMSAACLDTSEPEIPIATPVRGTHRKEQEYTANHKSPSAGMLKISCNNTTVEPVCNGHCVRQPPL